MTLNLLAQCVRFRSVWALSFRKRVCLELRVSFRSLGGLSGPKKKGSFHWIVASFDPSSPYLEPRQLGTVFEELLDGYVPYMKLWWKRVLLLHSHRQLLKHTWGTNKSVCISSRGSNTRIMVTCIIKLYETKHALWEWLNNKDSQLARVQNYLLNNNNKCIFCFVFLNMLKDKPCANSDVNTVAEYFPFKTLLAVW